jgi:hypothetical protein
VIVRAAPPEHYGWIAERAQIVIGPAFRAIEAIDEAGKIHGMVGYDGLYGNMVCAHIALDHPAALRHLLEPGFRIPFRDLGRGVLVAQVLSTNERSLRLMARLGFTYLARVRDGKAKGVDLCLFEMRAEDCKWIRKGAA